MTNPFDLADAFLVDAPTEPKPSAEAPYITSLNPEQKEAVLTTEGPVLVLSAPERGKRGC